MLSRRQMTDRSVQYFFLVVALISITSLLLIGLFLFVEGIPILKFTSLYDFLFGRLW